MTASKGVYWKRTFGPPSLISYTRERRKAVHDSCKVEDMASSTSSGPTDPYCEHPLNNPASGSASPPHLSMCRNGRLSPKPVSQSDMSEGRSPPTSRAPESAVPCPPKSRPYCTPPPILTNVDLLSDVVGIQVHQDAQTIAWPCGWETILPMGIEGGVNILEPVRTC